jgi:hypothetical protein
MRRRGRFKGMEVLLRGKPLLEILASGAQSKLSLQDESEYKHDEFMGGEKRLE